MATKHFHILLAYALNVGARQELYRREIKIAEKTGILIEKKGEITMIDIYSIIILGVFFAIVGLIVVAIRLMTEDVYLYVCRWIRRVKYYRNKKRNPW